jgi:hypothetical protein
VAAVPDHPEGGLQWAQPRADRTRGDAPRRSALQLVRRDAQRAGVAWDGGAGVIDYFGLVESAAIGLRRAGREVSVRNVADVVKVLRGGRGMRWSMIAAILDANQRFEPGRSTPATPRQPAGNTTGNGSTHNGQHPGQRAGNLRAPGSKVLVEDGRPKPTDSTSPPARRARAAKPLPEIPDELRDDVDRLVAIDASTRVDGKIADSIVDENLTTLRRQLEKKGLGAVRHGIDVALGKSKGVRYAAGVARRALPQEYTAPDPPSSPGLFGAGVTHLDDRRISANGKYLPGETRREYNLRVGMPPPMDEHADEPADPALRAREPVAL